MEPIKLRILKRRYADGEVDNKIPIKKRIRNAEKENKNSDPKYSSSADKGNNILKNSPVPSTRSNSKMLDLKNSSSDDEIDSVFDELTMYLSKSGFKVDDSKCSPKGSTVKEKKELSGKKDLGSSNKRQSKTKKDLLKEFEKLDIPPEKEKTKSKSKKKKHELERLTEDSILKDGDLAEENNLQISETSPTEESVATPRRSSRKRSSFLNETLLMESELAWAYRNSFKTSKKKTKKSSPSQNEIEKTPSTKKVSKTPVKQDTPVPKQKETPNKTPKGKSSSAKKLKTVEPKTPSNKTEIPLPKTPLEKARNSLHVSTVPDRLPCREKEYNNIYTFLENKLLDGIGGCMYISGVPGTGKTATVSQVIRNLQERFKDGTVPEFKYIEINGMRLSNPRQAYVQLWQKLFDKKEKITPDRAQRLLDDWFNKSDRQKPRKTTLLLVDELDLICTKKQDVVYNLLEWPTRTHSRLVVLTIANTMDMPERLFKGRVTSRMGLTRLTFMPYTHKQLEEIVSLRLKGLDAFVSDAVRLVSRKVAAVSGDARRALDICRRATELPPENETVKICHIEQALKEMTNSNIVKVIRNCGEMERLFLLSMNDVSLRSNAEEVDIQDVMDQLFAMCVLEGMSRPSVCSILSVVNRLKCCRLIFSSRSNAGVLQRVTLNVTHDDIHFALKT